MGSDPAPHRESSSSDGNQLLGAEHNCPPDSGEFPSSAAGTAMPPIFMKDSLECL